MSKNTKSIPALGIIGSDNIREAFEGDLNQLRDLLQGAIKKALELGGEEDWWPCVHALFDDFIVVERKDGRLLKYSYTVSGSDIALGTPVEVKKTFEELKESKAPKDPSRVNTSTAFIEAAPGKKGVWQIRVIRAGVSANGNLYSESLLREAVNQFNGVRVFAKSDVEHLTGGGKDVRNLIGGLSEAVFVEGAPGEVQATLTLIEPEGAIASKLKEAWERGLSDLFGFSIVAEARSRASLQGGRRVREAVAFTAIRSVDLIVEPAAGGAVIDLVEAKQTNIKEQMMTREEVTTLLEGKGILTSQQAIGKSDEELRSVLSEALTPSPSPTEDKTLEESIRMVEARVDMKERVRGSSLPDKAREKLIAQFSEAKTFTQDEVAEAITSEADYLASFTQSGSVSGLGTGRVEVSESQAEKVDARLDAFFDPEHKDHRHARSFKECYQDMTGDRQVTGQESACDPSLMREALATSNFANVLGNALHRRLVADYNRAVETDVWRKLVTIGNAVDFRKQERVRFGGYGDIPAVAEGAAYAAVSSPSDEKVEFAVTKRGGLETVTLEMIKNDDVSAIRQIPIRLSRAAKRTLGKFTLDFLASNPTIYNSRKLFEARIHKNLGSAALTKQSLATGRLAMLSQKEAGSEEKIGIAPKYLWVPHQLEQTAYDLFRRAQNHDPDFIQSLSIEVVPVWYWTDATNWYLSADPMNIPTIEIAFLDGNEEPELFIQDNPTVGSMFSNDKLTWKLRHIYGGSVIDYRGLYGAVVA